MYIYSSKEQPFGLLSNNASVPINIDGEEWDTVTGYVYINMFKNPVYQQKMLENLHPSPYQEYSRLKHEEDIEIYNTSIERAQLTRFNQNKALRDRLFGTGKATIVYKDDPIMEEFLNQYRSKLGEQYRHALWDDIRQVVVPRDEVVRVVEGVSRALEKNPDLSNDLTYEQLLRYETVDPIESIEPFDLTFINLNKLVPVIKKRTFKTIYEQQVKQFKDHLLDVQLDYLLKNEYPSVPKDLYERAKHQQILGESPESLKTYKNQLFSLYKKGSLDRPLVNKLTFFPNEDLLKEVIQSSHKVDDDNTIEIRQDDPFLPHYPEDITIDGSTYRTGVHYAYHNLYKSMGNYQVNVNDFSNIKDLVEGFERFENNWSVDNITINNERAQLVKYTNPTMAQLLLLTDNEPLIWDDRTDPVLGSAGDNRAGIMMEHLRSQAIPSLRHIDSFALNIFFANWIVMRAKDYKSTLKMVNNPVTDDMVQIYMCPFTISDSPDKERQLLKRKAKMTLDEINVIWPLFSYQLGVLHKLNEEDAMKAIVYAQYRLAKKPTSQYRSNATDVLKRVYDKLSPRINVSKDSFIDNIIGRSWNRINYWA
jgi:predicted NAD-dependent protein-ADP-ribosyltransferase YbiA (DUF1768 family)